MKKTPENPKAPRARGRQRKYVEGVIAGKTKQKAKQDAGYAETTKGKDIESRPTVQALFTELLSKAGVSDELLAKRIYQGLHAMETKFFQSQGIVIDRRNCVNWSERREMLLVALKVKGHLIDKHELRMTRTLEELLDGSHE